MEDRLSAIAHDIRSSASFGGAASVSPLRVHFATMGCAKNEVDSERMAALLCEAGCVIAEDPEDAECIIVNTCSFIQAATEESIEAVFDACDLPLVKAKKAKVIVAGCMPARYGDDLASSLHEVDTFVPCSKEDDIASIVGRLFPGRLGGERVALAAGAPSAYVKISDGCDRFCSFCTIPFIRGRYHSFSFGQVNAEVSRAIAAGSKEIVLIAQDTGRWGTDFSHPSSLAELVESLARKHPDTWFRIMYVQPEGITDQLLDVMASHDNIAPYLDIPFQHVSGHLLTAMNRTGSRDEHLSLLGRIRNRIEDVTIRTTLMVGFPGETEEDFEELCTFVEEADFDYVGVFAYSQEDGTRAARMADQVDEEEKQLRASRLRDVADAVSSVRISERIGRSMDVLVLGCEEDGQLYGRAQCQAPDVDGVVYLSHGAIGEFVHVTISDTLLYEMEGD